MNLKLVKAGVAHFQIPEFKICIFYAHFQINITMHAHFHISEPPQITLQKLNPNLGKISSHARI